MSAHTPGRCTCTISNRSGAHQYEGERWQRIEHCPLHAAAPEMLEALERTFVSVNDLLIGCPHCSYLERVCNEHIREAASANLARAAIAKAKP